MRAQPEREKNLAIRVTIYAGGDIIEVGGSPPRKEKIKW